MARASRPCVDCPALIPPNVSGARCPACKKKRNRKTSADRRAVHGTQVYDTSAWQTARRRAVAGRPCVDCGTYDGIEADHVPARALLIAAGIHQPDHARWLQPRCARCHGWQTQIRDRPLLARLAAGENAETLCREASDWTEVRPGARPLLTNE